MRQWDSAAGRHHARRVPVKVLSVYRDEEEVSGARPGENLRLRLQGIEEEDISAGKAGGRLAGNPAGPDM
jgi:translation elongation factor EF-1alpha